MSRWIPRLVLLPLLLSPAACDSDPPPRTGTPGVIRTGETVHVIRSGETLPSIAALYGVTEQSIRERNPGLIPDSLGIGKELRIPPSKPEVRRIEPASAAPR